MKDKRIYIISSWFLIWFHIYLSFLDFPSSFPVVTVAVIAGVSLLLLVALCVGMIYYHNKSGPRAVNEGKWKMLSHVFICLNKDHTDWSWATKFFLLCHFPPTFHMAWNNFVLFDLLPLPNTFYISHLSLFFPGNSEEIIYTDVRVIRNMEKKWPNSDHKAP